MSLFFDYYNKIKVSLFGQDPFKLHVEKVLEENGYNENDIIEKIFDETIFKQKFVFIIVKKNDEYFVLLILDELHRDKVVVKRQRHTPANYIIITKYFVKESQARNYIDVKIIGYKKGVFDWEAQYYRIVKCEPECHHQSTKSYDKCFLPGDYITRDLQGFWLASHAGIYIGQGKIVHYDSPDKAATIWNCIRGNGNHHVHLAEIANFVTNQLQEIKIVVHCFQQSLKEEKVKAAVKLAEKKFGDGEYRFLTHNCQHFASLISTGRLEMIDREIVQEGISSAFAAVKSRAAFGYGNSKL